MAVTLGVIVGNRDFFPDVLIAEARRDLMKLFGDLNLDVVWLGEADSKLGAVETWADARKCGDLLRRERERLDGILVCLPNFGDEKGVADSIRLADVTVPILVQAYPDDLDQFGLTGGAMRFAERSRSAIIFVSLDSSTA